MNGQEHIEQMYAFVVVDDDGTEGVPAIDNGKGMIMPLVGADMARVESLRPYVESMAKSLGKPVTLMRFSVREELEVIEP